MKPFLLLAFAVVLVGCQSTEKTSQWRRPNDFSGPRKSVAVVVAAYQPAVRAEMETAIVAALKNRGVAARTTYQTASLSALSQDRAASAARLGGDSVLVLRLADPLSLRAITIQPGNSGEALQPWQNWFEFFTAKGAFSAGPVAMNSSGDMGIHAALFESPSGRLLWSATAVRKVPAGGLQSQSAAANVVRMLQNASLVP